jgi:uncharacterized protein YndB with AHSA1/START domain
MTEDGIVHDMIVLERDYPVPPARVFAAWADPDARRRWTPPSPGAEVVMAGGDFRVGGCEISHCGPRGNPMFQVELRYQDIVADRRIVFTERISTDGRPLAVSLVSVTLADHAGGTRLRLIDQIAALDGADMIAGSRSGYAAALDNLALEFVPAEIH